MLQRHQLAQEERNDQARVTLGLDPPVRRRSRAIHCRREARVEKGACIGALLRNVAERLDQRAIHLLERLFRRMALPRRWRRTLDVQACQHLDVVRNHLSTLEKLGELETVLEPESRSELARIEQEPATEHVKVAAGQRSLVPAVSHSRLFEFHTLLQHRQAGLRRTWLALGLHLRSRARGLAFCSQPGFLGCGRGCLVLARLDLGLRLGFLQPCSLVPRSLAGRLRGLASLSLAQFLGSQPVVARLGPGSLGSGVSRRPRRSRGHTRRSRRALLGGRRRIRCCRTFGRGLASCGGDLLRR